jgi:hypothetical protein
VAGKLVFFPTLREEHKITVFESGELTTVFAPKREEVARN